MTFTALAGQVSKNSINPHARQQQCQSGKYSEQQQKEALQCQSTAYELQENLHNNF
jgi:hypothetical protein